MAPSSPSGGGSAAIRPRRRSGSPRRRRHRRSTPFVFLILRGNVSCSPRVRASQGPSRGRGRRPVASAYRWSNQDPSDSGRSHRADAPGRGSASAVESRGRAAGIGVSIAKSRVTTRSTLPSTAASCLSKAMAAMAPARIGADAGQFAQAVERIGEGAGFRDRLGAGLEVAGAGVIAEAGPSRHDALLRRRREGLPRRGSVRESAGSTV